MAVVAGSKAKRRALLDRICRTQTARGAAERDNADDDATLVSQTTTAALADASDDGWQGAATPLPEDDGGRDGGWGPAGSADHLL